MKSISIIIPFKGSTATLPRLFSSIPEDDNIEIILVENSNRPRSKEEIGIDRDYILLNAEENRYAGGARNVGIEAATGKWLIFADADDFFTDDAFAVFNKYVDSSYDLIYFGCDSVFLPSLLPAKRHKRANQLIIDKVKGKITENKVKVEHIVPWAKMILRDVVINNSIQYDETMVSNDVMFAVTCGLKSKLSYYDSSKVYVVSDNKNNITKLWSKESMYSRIDVIIARNKLLEIFNLKKYRISVFTYYLSSMISNPRIVFLFPHLCFRYRNYIMKDLINILHVIYRKFSKT